MSVPTPPPERRTTIPGAVALPTPQPIEPGAAVLNWQAPACHTEVPSSISCPDCRHMLVPLEVAVNTLEPVEFTEDFTWLLRCPIAGTYFEYRVTQ